MTFSHLDDPGVRASCEFVQEVVSAVVATLAPVDEVQRHPAMSRRELARKAGIGQAPLLAILHGDVWPRSDRLARIAHVAGVTLGVL